METALTGWMGAALLAGMMATSSLFAQASNQLSTGKSLTQPPLGVQQDVGNLPMNMIASPCMDTSLSLFDFDGNNSMVGERPR